MVELHTCVIIYRLCLHVKCITSRSDTFRKLLCALDGWNEPYSYSTNAVHSAKLEMKMGSSRRIYLIFSCVRVQNTRHGNLIEKCATNSYAPFPNVQFLSGEKSTRTCNRSMLFTCTRHDSGLSLVQYTANEWKCFFLFSQRIHWNSRRFATYKNWILFECFV